MIEKEISITKKSISLKGILTIPKDAFGIVIFAHGSGSSRLSVRNQFVAKKFNEKKLATLQFDLLTQEEEKIDNVTTEYRFNIDLLAKRLVLVTDWLETNKDTQNLNIGYFGASTGASAALIAAAIKKDKIKAIVSRGGRSDLAKDHLKNVNGATILIVGSLDLEVISLNEIAFEKLQCVKELKIIQGATHLFEEEGKLEEVEIISRDWFLKYLS